MTKTFRYLGTKFSIDTTTLILQSSEADVYEHFNKQLKRNYVSWRTKDGQVHMTTKARLICTAFHGQPGPNAQCAHIDDDSANDAPSNLCWMTRKENNSQPHARKMKSKNAKSSSHDNQVIKATKDGKTQYFYNGKQAAAVLRCSSPLIYRVVNKTDYAKTAKGWSLEYIPFEQCLNEISSSTDFEI